MQHLLEQQVEVIPVVGQQLELELLGNSVQEDGFGDGFEAAHHETAAPFANVDVTVGIANHRQHRVNADRLRH